MFLWAAALGSHRRRFLFSHLTYVLPKQSQHSSLDRQWMATRCGCFPSDHFDLRTKAANSPSRQLIRNWQRRHMCQLAFMK
jgi:hypothetical protein